jgi:SAM-dependent methyltransferase
VSDLLNLACGSQAHPAWTNVDHFPARVRYQLPLVGAVMRAAQEGRGHYTTASGARVLIADLRKGVPFPDASFDVVYHSNFLEHLERAAGRRFLAECRRVLRAGGLIRVVVPDLEEKARAYLAALESGDVDAHEFAVADLIDQMVRTTTGGELANLLEPDREDVAKPLRQQIGERLIGKRRAADTGELHKWMYDSESLSRALADAGFTRPMFRTHTESDIPDWSHCRLDEKPDGSPLHHACIYAEARVRA